MIKSDEDIVVMRRIEDDEKGDIIMIMIMMSHQILRLFFQTRGDVEDAWQDSKLSSRETLEVIFDPGSLNEKDHHHLRSWIVVKIYKVNNKPFPPFHFSNFEYSRATEHHQIQQLCSDYSLMDNESVFQF